MSVHVLKFGALWCAPCRASEKVWQKVAPDFPGLRLEKVDVDDDAALAARYGVRSVPTVVVERDGVEVDRWVGAVPEQKLRDLLRSVGASPTIESGNPQSRIG